MKISKSTVTTHLYSARSCLISPPVLQRVLFSALFSVFSQNKPSTITRVTDYNVHECRDPSCQLMKCHAVTTLQLPCLQLQYQTLVNKKHA